MVMQTDGQTQVKRIAAFAAILLIVASLWRFPLYPDDVRILFQIAFEVATVLLLAALIWERVSKWWALFLLLSLISAFHPMSTKYSFAAFRNILLGCLWFYFLFVVIQKEYIPYLFDAICIIALANVAFLIIQYLNIDPLYAPKGGGNIEMRVGLMANPNEVSALLAFCFPAFLRGKWKWLIPAVLLGLILAHSFAGPVAVGVGTILYIGVKKKLIFSIILILGGLLLFYFFVDKPNLKRRIPMWKFALKLTAQHWVIGLGVGHWRAIIPAIEEQQGRNSSFWQAHNEYIQMFFEMGIGFLIIVTGYFYSIIRRFKPEAIIPIVAIAIIAVDCMVFFPFHIGTTAMLAITWMAILEINLKGMS